MKKTKIICTMGPTTSEREVVLQLAENGMDIARFNFSHGSHEEQKARMDMIKSVRKEVGRPIAILLDTKGPEIRTGLLKDGQKVTLVEGQEFVLTTEQIEGDNTRVSITYDGLAEDVEPGKKILIDDGLIELEIKAIEGTEIICSVINGGDLGQRKGVNVPNVPVRLPAITEKDKEDIIFGISQDVDFIAASFVRNADAILEIKKLLEEHDSRYIPIIATVIMSQSKYHAQAAVLLIFFGEKRITKVRLLNILGVVVKACLKMRTAYKSNVTTDFALKSVKRVAQKMILLPVSAKRAMR